MKIIYKANATMTTITTTKGVDLLHTLHIMLWHTSDRL